MSALTTKELGAIEDQLTSEKTMISKYLHYAEETQDTQLKGMLQGIAKRHQAHYDKLFTLLG